MIQRGISLGYGTVTKESMQDRSLSIEAKAIYAYLCSFAGGKDEAYPSISKMCYDLGISRGRFYKHFNMLIDREYVSKTMRYKADTGYRGNNLYTIDK